MSGLLHSLPLSFRFPNVLLEVTGVWETFTATERSQIQNNGVSTVYCATSTE